MKKIISVLFMSAFTIFALTAKSSSDFQLTLESRFLSDSAEVIPATSLSFGIGNEDSFMWNAYLRAEYPFEPLGSKNCGVATFELFAEAGVGMVHPIYKVGDFKKVNLGLDIGYYAQAIHALGHSRFSAGYNGLVFRGKISYLFAKVLSLPVEIGCQYQFSVYPVYDRYTGLGLFIKI